MPFFRVECGQRVDEIIVCRKATTKHGAAVMVLGDKLKDGVSEFSTIVLIRETESILDALEEFGVTVNTTDIAIPTQRLFEQMGYHLMFGD